MAVLPMSASLSPALEESGRVLLSFLRSTIDLAASERASA